MVQAHTQTKGDKSVTFWVDRVLEWASGFIILVTLSGLFISLFLEVIIRYLTSSGLGWPNEMPAILFPWLTMSGAVLAAQYGRHIAVLGLMEKIPTKFSRIVMVAGALLAFATFAFLFWEGLKVMEIVGSEVYPVTGLTANFPYAALLAGFVGLAITALTTIPLILKADNPVVPRDVGGDLDV